jgi:4'-phosphopantetheinyl transferase
MLNSGPKLPPHEVHIWINELDCTETTIRQKKLLLSPEEHSRAERFLRKLDHDRYVFAHGRTREILAKYLDCTPNAIAYEYEKFGKPQLRTAINPHQINFNLSHSGNRLMLGVVAAARIGVDIEQIRPESATLDVAARFFTHRENEDLKSLSDRIQIEGFFNCWTRKEAYLKALGCGLSIDPREVEVTLKPHEPPKLLKSAAAAPHGTWSLFHHAHSGYISAMATDALNPSVQIKSGWTNPAAA